LVGHVENTAYSAAFTVKKIPGNLKRGRSLAATVRPITQENLICSYCNKLKWNERENDKQQPSSSHQLGVLSEAASITEFSAETETNDFSPTDENRTRLLLNTKPESVKNLIAKMGYSDTSLIP
jgi:hypothetical protein